MTAPSARCATRSRWIERAVQLVEIFVKRRFALENGFYVRPDVFPHRRLHGFARGHPSVDLGDVRDVPLDVIVVFREIRRAAAVEVRHRLRDASFHRFAPHRETEPEIISIKTFITGAEHVGSVRRAFRRIAKEAGSTPI